MSSANEKIAFQLPGQGVDFAEAVRDLSNVNTIGHEAADVATETFEIIHEETGVDVEVVAKPDSGVDVFDTRVAHLLLYAAGYAGGRILMKKGISPNYIRGHSASAFTAAGVAGALALRYGTRAMVKRGELMHRASIDKPGGILIVGDLDEGTVEKICRQLGIDIANFNSPKQLILSGKEMALREARKLIKSIGGRATPPKEWRAGAVHSPNLLDEESELRQYMEAEVPIGDADFSVVRNTDGRDTSVGQEIADDLGSMSRQVRWTDGTINLLRLGVTRFVEIGPKSKRVVSGLLGDHGIGSGDGITIEHIHDLLNK